MKTNRFLCGHNLNLFLKSTYLPVFRFHSICTMIKPEIGHDFDRVLQPFLRKWKQETRVGEGICGNAEGTHSAYNPGASAGTEVGLQNDQYIS